MSTPCRERIVAAVETALGLVAWSLVADFGGGYWRRGRTNAPAGVTVERDRDDPVAAAELPLLVIYEGDEEAFADFTGEDAFVLTVDVEGYALAADMPALRASVDGVLLGDRTLGGLARDLTIAGEAPPLRNDFDDDVRARGFVRRYAIDYATREGDAFTFAHEA